MKYSELARVVRRAVRGRDNSGERIELLRIPDRETGRFEMPECSPEAGPAWLRLVRWLPVALVVFALLSPGPVSAAGGYGVVEPGTTPELREGDGLVLISIQANAPIEKLTFMKGYFGRMVIKQVPRHRSDYLIRVKAGAYHLRRAAVMPSGYYNYVANFDEDELPVLNVAPEKVSYAGLVVISTNPVWFSVKASVNSTDERASAFDWLQEHHPQVAADREIVNAHDPGDPFFRYYAEERAIKSKAEE